MNGLARVWLRALKATPPAYGIEVATAKVLAALADESGTTPLLRPADIAHRIGAKPESCRGAMRSLRKKGWLHLCENNTSKPGSINQLTLPMSPDEALALIRAHETGGSLAPTNKQAA